MFPKFKTKLRKILPRLSNPWLFTLVGLFVVVGVGLIGNIAHATTVVERTLAMLVGWLVYFFVFIFGKFLLLLVTVLVAIFKYNNFINEPIVILGWTIVRDFMNLFFIIALLIIAFATVFKVQAYHYKQMLPKLVIAALVVNFSKMITGIFIDISQVVMMTFVNAFADLAGGNFAKLLGLDKMLSLSTAWNGVGNTGEPITAIGILGTIILALILIIVANVVIIVMIVVLAVRTVMLWILTILSPVAWVAPLFPGGQKYASQWWENISKYLVTGVVMAFFVWLTFASLQINKDVSLAKLPEIKTEQQGNKAIEVGESDKLAFAASEAGTTKGMWSLVIGIAMLMGSIMVAQQLGGIAGSFAGKMSGLLQTGGKLAARYTAGSAALALGKKTGIRQLYHGIKGFAQRKKEKDMEVMIGAKALGMDVGQLGFWKTLKRGSIDKGAAFAAKKRLAVNQEKEKELRYQLEYGGKAGEIMREDLHEEVATKGGEYLKNKKTLRDLEVQKAENDKLRSDGKISDVKWKQEYNKIKEKIEKLEEPLNKSKDEFNKSFEKLYGRRLTDDELSGIQTIEEKDGKMVYKNDAGAQILGDYNEKNVSELANMKKTEYEEQKNFLKSDIAAIQGGHMTYDEAEGAKQEVEEEIKKLDKKIADIDSAIETAENSGDTTEVDRLEKQKEHDDKVREGLNAKLNALKYYLEAFRTGDNPFEDTEFVRSFSVDDESYLRKLEEEKTIINEDESISKDEKEKRIKAIENEEKQFVTSTINAQQRVDQVKTKQGELEDLELKAKVSLETISESEKRRIRDEWQKLVNEIKKDESKLYIKAQPVRGFYSKEAFRRKSAEEYEKIKDVSNSDELRAMLESAMKDAEKNDEGRYKVAAVLRRYGETANENEYLNDYGFTSDAHGYKNFMEEKIKRLFKDKREYMELANDLTYIHERIGHWETGRMMKYNAKKGGLDWMTEEEWVKTRLAELSKMNPRQIAQFNRLSYGGEIPLPQGGRKFKMSPLGVGILMTFGRELSRTIQRGEMDPNAILHIWEEWEKVKDIPTIKNMYYEGKYFEEWMRERVKVLPDLNRRVRSSFEYSRMRASR